MHRFYIPPEALQQNDVRLPEEIARQITRVLRLRPDDRIVLFCGDGVECEAVLEEVGASRVTARVTGRHAPQVEMPCSLHVGVAVLKGEKPEWAVQKLTEIGVSRITLLQTERSVVTAGEERWPKRLERYSRIAREAAEQCGRVRLPEVAGPTSLDALLREEAAALRLFLEPRAPSSLACQLGSCPERILLLIGPEGGFTPAELERAQEAGALPVRLGTRILRAETASVAAAAVVMALAEE